MLARDPQKAESVLRQGLETMRSMGAEGFVPFTVALLARSLFVQARYLEGQRVVDEIHEAELEGDISVEILRNSTQGLLSAQRGELDEARKRVRSAVDLAARGDDILRVQIP